MRKDKIFLYFVHCAVNTSTVNFYCYVIRVNEYECKSEASIKIVHRRQIDSVLRVDLSFASLSFLGKTFQKRRVSSPAPVTIVVPSGFMAK